MKNTKGHSPTTSASRHGTTKREPTTQPSPSYSRAAPRRVSPASTTTKSPSLATAARSNRVRTATKPLDKAPSQPRGTAKSTRKTPAPRSAKAASSLVHDAVRRAFHAANPSDGPAEKGSVEECERLRGQLVRVMADHQRQADEIVALRALARSLKEEVESMQKEPASPDQTSVSAPSRRQHHADASMTHEFFQLDAQVDALREENALLRAQVDAMAREKRELEDVLDQEIPRCEMLAVQARAELESTVSQLHGEQQANDALRREVAYYKARSRSPVRTRRPAVTLADDQADEDEDKENSRVRLNGSTRESLMSSVASLSMSAASVFSSQLDGDVHALKAELRRLHRSIDASVLSARSGDGKRFGSQRQQQREREQKTQEQA